MIGLREVYEFHMHALKWLQDFGGASTRHWHTSCSAFFWMGLPVDEDSASESAGDSWERLLDELQGEMLLKDLQDQRALEASSLDAVIFDGKAEHGIPQASKRRGQKKRRRMQLRKRPRAQGASSPPPTKKMK